MNLGPTFDGPPPAFIVMCYIVGMEAANLGLLGAVKWLEIDFRIITRPFVLTLAGYGLIFIIYTTAVNMLGVINLMIGVNQHKLDAAIIASLLPLSAFSLVSVYWIGHQAIKDMQTKRIKAGSGTRADYQPSIEPES